MRFAILEAAKPLKMFTAVVTGWLSHGDVENRLIQQYKPLIAAFNIFSERCDCDVKGVSNQLLQRCNCNAIMHSKPIETNIYL